MGQNIFEAAYHGALLIAVFLCGYVGTASSVTLLEEWELEKKNQAYFNAHANTFLAEPLIEWINEGKPGDFQRYLQELQRRIEFYKKFYSTDALDKALSSLIRNTDEFFGAIETENLYRDAELYKKLKWLYKGNVQPLEIAIFTNAEWAVDVFLNAGALINTGPQNRFKPLHFAILKVAADKTENLSVIEKLLQAGADPTSKLRVRESDGKEADVSFQDFIDSLVFSSDAVKEKIQILLNEQKGRVRGSTSATSAPGQSLNDLLLLLSQGLGFLIDVPK